jgi:hypothetical protein
VKRQPAAKIPRPVALRAWASTSRIPTAELIRCRYMSGRTATTFAGVRDHSGRIELRNRTRASASASTWRSSLVELRSRSRRLLFDLSRGPASLLRTTRRRPPQPTSRSNDPTGVLAAEDQPATYAGSATPVHPCLRGKAVAPQGQPFRRRAACSGDPACNLVRASESGLVPAPIRPDRLFGGRLCGELGGCRRRRLLTRARSNPCLNATLPIRRASALPLGTGVPGRVRAISRRRAVLMIRRGDDRESHVERYAGEVACCARGYPWTSSMTSTFLRSGARPSTIGARPIVRLDRRCRDRPLKRRLSFAPAGSWPRRLPP